MLLGMRVFLAAPYSQLVSPITGRVIGEWRERIESMRQDLIERGAMVFSAHHNEQWGLELLPPEECTPSDFHAMRLADVVCAVVGSPPSGGVNVELGWASAMSKPILIILSTKGDHSPIVSGLGTIARVAYLNEPGQWDVNFRAGVADSLESLCHSLPPRSFESVSDAGYVGSRQGHL